MNDLQGQKMDFAREELMALKLTLQKRKTELHTLQEERNKEKSEPEVNKEEINSHAKTELHTPLVRQHKEPLSMKRGEGGRGIGGGGEYHPQSRGSKSISVMTKS